MGFAEGQPLRWDGIAGRESENERAFNIISLFGAVMFDFVLPIGAEMIEAEAVGFGIDDVDEPVFEVDELGGIDLALEDGILDALAEVEAGFGGPSEAVFAGGGGGADVVGDEDIHGGKSR